MAANGSQAADTPDSADNSSKAPAATEEDNFVIIDCDDGEKLELPVNDEDSTLNLATLVSAFPGAVGLKFKNPTTGASRALQMDSTGGKFMAPPGGWSNKSFSVIYGASQRDASGTTKRRKLDDDASESTCEKEARYSEPVGTDPPATCDLIVLGLPYKTSDEEMKKYFEQFGEVVCTEIKRLPSGQSKGFGFVRMADYAIQKRLLDQDYHQIDGRQCQVKLPPRKGGGPSTTSQGSHQTSQVFGLKLFVGRLPTTATTDSVRQFFIEEARKIDSKAAVTDVFLPRPFRAFGFVSLSSMSACVELVKRGSAIMEGTSISITSAAPREQMQAMQSRNHEPSGPTYGYGRGSQFQWGASPPPHQYPAHHHHPPSAYGYTHAPVPTAYGYYETNAPSAYGAGTAATDYSSYYQQQHHDRR